MGPTCTGTPRGCPTTESDEPRTSKSTGPMCTLHLERDDDHGHYLGPSAIRPIRESFQPTMRRGTRYALIAADTTMTTIVITTPRYAFCIYPLCFHGCPTGQPFLIPRLEQERGVICNLCTTAGVLSQGSSYRRMFYRELVNVSKILLRHVADRAMLLVAHHT